MTEFRRRKDDGRVFPIQKRKPYGISRQLAYEDVQAFRKEGKKARLIKTNNKLDLYAPYVSDIPDAPETHTKMEPEKEEKISSSRKVTEGQRIDLREQLALVSGNGKSNMNNAELKEYFSNDSRIKATIKDGKLTFLSVDPAHISMIMETMDTDLPDGFLYPVTYGKDFEMEWSKSQIPEGNVKLRWPELNFNSDSWSVRLEGESLKKFMKDLRSIDGDAVRFNLIGGTDKSSVQICRMEVQDVGKDKAVPIATFNASSNRMENKDVPDGWDTSDRVSMPREYLQKTIIAMLGRKGSLNPSDQVLTMQLKRDYPLVASTRRIGPNGEHIEIQGAVAPRME
ncbi:MAG: hypothetical protein M1605_02290 [Candidatus Thermoplasmatota archaeon]|nr:hypothetical protein [Candidatus Thermoplasmatota archaeon]